MQDKVFLKFYPYLYCPCSIGSGDPMEQGQTIINIIFMNQKKHFLKELIYASLLSLLVFSCGCDAGHGKGSRERIHFAFHEEAPNIIMPVVFQDSIKANLIFDTGWGNSNLDSSFVSNHPSLVSGKELLGLGISCSAWNPSSRFPAKVYKALEFKLGEHTAKYENYFVSDYRTMMGVKGVDGIAGIPPADSSKVWHLNFEHNFIAIHRADSFEMPDGCMTFPLKTYISPHGMGITANLPLEIKMPDGDTLTLHRDFAIDSGAWSELTLTCEAPETARINRNKDDAVWLPTPDNKYTRNYVASASLLGTELDSFRIQTYDFKTGVTYPYVLGSNFLKRFNVYLDLQRKVIGLEPLRDFTRLIDKHARCLHFNFDDKAIGQGRWVIKNIADTKENYFYTAGLQKGDELVSMNGIPMKELNMELKEKIFRSEYIVCKLIRDGKTMEITVPVNKNEPLGF